MNRRTKIAVFSLGAAALGAFSFYNAFVDGFAIQIDLSASSSEQRSADFNAENVQLVAPPTGPDAPPLPEDYHYLKDGSVFFTGYQAFGVPSKAKELPSAPPLPEGQIYLPDGTIAYKTQPDYGGVLSPLSTEGRIYLADGTEAYKSPEDVQAEYAAAAKASYESALHANPALARLIEDEALQQGALDTLTDAWKASATWRTARYVSTERQIFRHYIGQSGNSGLVFEARIWFNVLTGRDGVDPDYEKQAFADELTKDIPVEYWDNLMAYDNKHSAMAARARIIDDMNRDRRLAAQRGTASTLAMGVGRLPDVFALGLGLLVALGLIRFLSRRNSAT